MDVICNSSHKGGCLQNEQNKHHIQVNTVINILFAGSTEKELHETFDTFWSEYTKLNHNNYPFGTNEFI